eukprot:scaffold2376_cov115-Isochrysis_galbana.AAC.14
MDSTSPVPCARWALSVDPAPNEDAPTNDSAGGGAARVHGLPLHRHRRPSHAPHAKQVHVTQHGAVDPSANHNHKPRSPLRLQRQVEGGVVAARGRRGAGGPRRAPAHPALRAVPGSPIRPAELVPPKRTASSGPVAVRLAACRGAGETSLHSSWGVVHLAPPAAPVEPSAQVSCSSTPPASQPPTMYRPLRSPQAQWSARPAGTAPEGRSCSHLNGAPRPGAGSGSMCVSPSTAPSESTPPNTMSTCATSGMPTSLPGTILQECALRAQGSPSVRTVSVSRPICSLVGTLRAWPTSWRRFASENSFKLFT